MDDEPAANRGRSSFGQRPLEGKAADQDFLVLQVTVVKASLPLVGTTPLVSMTLAFESTMVQLAPLGRVDWTVSVNEPARSCRRW